jgi:hypothetical protein
MTLFQCALDNAYSRYRQRSCFMLHAPGTVGATFRGSAI